MSTFLPKANVGGSHSAPLPVAAAQHCLPALKATQVDGDADGINGLIWLY